MPREDAGFADSLGLYTACRSEGRHERNVHGLPDHVVQHKARPGYETAQQKAQRELHRSSKFLDQKGCLAMAHLGQLGRIGGQRFAVTSGFTSMGARTVQPSLWNEDGAARGHALAQQRRAASTPVLRRLAERTACGREGAGHVNPFIDSFLTRNPTGGVFFGSSRGAPKVTQLSRTL
mmetsp:Transcript_10012/g.22392  ORF Transcript_10012/g.22392 Transcript_10012/m.22392 type:complete len:178 (+) Transcript_10012:152-685(+)